MLEVLKNWLIDQGLELPIAGLLARGIILVLIIVLSLIADFLAKRFILRGLTAIVNRTKTQWDDAILHEKVFNRLAHLNDLFGQTTCPHGTWLAYRNLCI